MPIVNITPSSKKNEVAFNKRMEEVRTKTKDVICRISGFPRHDVHVNLIQCPYRNVDPVAAEAIIYIDTCPHEELEQVSNTLCEEVAQLLDSMGFSGTMGLEVWPRFHPGPWCMILGGSIVDRVSHPRLKYS